MAESQLILNPTGASGPTTARSGQRARMDGAEDEAADANGAAFLALCGPAVPVPPHGGPAPKDAPEGTPAPALMPSAGAPWAGAAADQAAGQTGQPTMDTANGVSCGSLENGAGKDAAVPLSLAAIDAGAVNYPGKVDPNNGQSETPNAETAMQDPVTAAADAQPEAPADTNLRPPSSAIGEAQRPSGTVAAAGRRDRDQERHTGLVPGSGAQDGPADGDTMRPSGTTANAAASGHDGSAPAEPPPPSPHGNQIAHLSDASAHSGSDGQDPVRPDGTMPSTQARHDQIVARSIAHQLSATLHHVHGRPVEITLSPDELGRVTISLHADRDRLSVFLTADRPETLDLMRGNMDQLAKEFGDLGYADLSFAFAGSGGEERQDTATSPDADDQPAVRHADMHTAARPAPASAGRLDLRL